MKQVILRLAVVGLLLGILAGQARAEDRYALTAIRNTTDVTINYFYWWGNYSWDEGGANAAGEVSLEPGASHYYAREFTPGDEGSVPRLNVLFVSYTRGKYDGIPREYPLVSARAPAQEEGYYKHYHFGWRSNGRLDLFESR